jgi:hypothetical protein
VMSAVWNIAIDLGGSVGGALIGLSAALSGYSTAAWVMPATALLALPLLWSAGRSVSVPPASESPEPSVGLPMFAGKAAMLARMSSTVLTHTKGLGSMRTKKTKSSPVDERRLVGAVVVQH